MFAQACSIAQKFTLPVVISWRNYKGECGSGIGSLVVINEDGWFVTAFHVINQMIQLRDAAASHISKVGEIKKLETDESVPKRDKLRRLAADLKIRPDEITHHSTWLGTDNWQIGQVFGLPDVDLAIGQILNFDKTKIQVYPQFKDASKGMPVGTSLCKLGFPFHDIVPIFDPARPGFTLPPGAIPIPFFPLEGILTRMVNVEPQSGKVLPFPLMYAETSSPGLRGQSGGPTFDVHGTIWAIQSQTASLPLGFDSNKPGKEAEHLKYQFLNVGWGIHSETIISFLQQNNISYHLSTY